MTGIALLSFILATVGIVLILDLRPERIAKNVQSLFAPRMSIRERVLVTSGRRKRSKIAGAVLHVRDALEETGRKGRFGRVCAASLCIMAAGPVLGAVTGTFFPVPIALTAGILFPVFAAESAVKLYERRMSAELETALSVVTSSYLRTGNLVTAVEESLPNMRTPVAGAFREFLGNATTVSPDLSACIRRLQGAFPNRIFRDWCEVLLACAEDSSNRDALLPLVSELSEVRLVNSELTTVIAECRKEYWGMVLLTVANFPLLYFINRDWWNALTTTVGGHIVTALTGIVILVTAFLMIRCTRPIGSEDGRRRK